MEGKEGSKKGKEREEVRKGKGGRKEGKKEGRNEWKERRKEKLYILDRETLKFRPNQIRSRTDRRSHPYDLSILRL